MSRHGRKDTDTVVLVDCSSVTYAALYTVGWLSYNGDHTGVIYGFLRKVLDLSSKFKTNRFIFCWDSVYSHRSKAYKPYKEDRRNKREEMTADEKDQRRSFIRQSDLLRKKVMPQLGFCNSYFQDGFEADDLLGYWAERLKRKNLIMVTSDADMYQCLNYCHIWSLAKKKLFKKADFVKNYGLDPSQWPMAKAIGGCGSDNVVGIKGVSDPKSPTSNAIKYLRGELTKGKIFNRIEGEDGQGIIKRNLPLVTVPYRPDLLKPMIPRRDKLSRKRFVKVFNDYQFKSFLAPDIMAKWERRFLQ